MVKFGNITEEQYKNGLRSLNVNNSLGFEQTVTTLTHILAKVQEQKYYTLLGQSLTDFVPVEIGTGSYSGQIFQYRIGKIGDPFESGVVSPGNGVNKDANVDIEIDGANIKNNFWRFDYTVTKELIEMAKVNAENFSIIEQKESARLKTYQLGIQDVAFVGLKNDTAVKGLLNQSDVTVNTELLSANIKDMTLAQIHNFIKGLVNAFLANNNYTVYPNRLLLPTVDYNILGTQFSPEFPVKTVKEVMEDAFKGITGNDFKIVHAKYCDNAGTTGARYVLYNCDPDTLTMYLPRPYTPHPLFPAGALDLVSQAEAQFTGVWVKRPKEVLYLDVTAST